MDFHREVAIFSAFRRAAERPEYRIEKRTALRKRQGMWALVSEGGAILKRGDELANILAPVERNLMKLVAGCPPAEAGLPHSTAASKQPTRRSADTQTTAAASQKRTKNGHAQHRV